MEDIKKIATCPITRDIMKKPTLTPSGHTYEYNAIRDWVLKKRIDPMTREVLSLDNLKPNRALEDIINSLGPSSFALDSPCSASEEEEDKLNLECTVSEKENELAITVKLEEIKNIENRKGSDIVLVIDRSGSMGQQIEAQDASNRSIETGITCLDLVKHAVKTIVKSINKKDRLAIVIFDSEIEVLFEFTEITQFTVSQIINSLTKITPRYQTNIWGPLHEAIKMVNTRTDKTRNPSIVFLTDGQPNIKPPRGELYMFEKVKPDFPVFMFGFTYAVDSKLLYDLSKKACFGFISDGSMLGTNFVNIIANILSIHSDINMTLKLKNSTPKGLPQKGGTEEVIVEQKFIRYGIPINYYFRNMDLDNIEDIVIMVGTNKYKFNAKDLPKTNEIMEIKAKMLICDFIEESIKTNRVFTALSLEKTKLLEIIEEISKLPKTKFIDNLIKNLNDQILMAFSDSVYMNKWGIHYLFSWITGQKNNIKINFKDSAGETYSSKIFETIVDRIDDIYNKLPAPKPTKVTRNTTTVTNMASLNNRYGGCWGPNSLIETSRGILKISDLNIDDIIKTKTGVSKIKYITKHHQNNLEFNLVKIGSLEITPWHPILIENKWEFPIKYLKSNNKNIITVKYDTVYNLVLEESSDHIIKVNDIYSICMAHTYNNDPILYHNFFGNYQLVCRELAECDTDINGIKIISHFTRGNNNDINGIN
jgi:uncharacterized protein YegL